MMDLASDQAGITTIAACEIDPKARGVIADHHECGHAPCGRCGKPILKKKDGTPREHKWTDCKEKECPDRFVYVPERETRKEP